MLRTQTTTFAAWQNPHCKMRTLTYFVLSGVSWHGTEHGREQYNNTELAFLNSMRPNRCRTLADQVYNNSRAFGDPPLP